MSLFQSQLFFRIVSKNGEVYFLKIITLAIAFACTTVILLFSTNEFGYDRSHQNYSSVVRLIQRNNSESYDGNRLSNKIPYDVYMALRSISADSLISARVKLMDKVNVTTFDRFFNESRVYAADPDITKIFSFTIVDGSLEEFQRQKRSIMISSSDAAKYFGSIASAGQILKISTLADTVSFTVAAVYTDFPENSHEEFNCIINFDSSAIRLLHFNPEDAALYGRVLQGSGAYYESILNQPNSSNDLYYRFQPVAEIYFGPRVTGEDAKHGDHYSIVILICITALILFLALTSFMNLTTLTLPYRSKELAVKKLAGTSQTNLMIAFAKESFLIVGISLFIGIIALVLTSIWIKPILAVDFVSLLFNGDFRLYFSLLLIFLVIASAPLFMTLRFARATPTRLLSTETITFPGFKKTITVLQLGISIFLIVGSMVIRRQVTYSLVKEPGRNNDQIVYLSYPHDLTNERLQSLRETWKKFNPNVIDVMATSQLPNRVGSKELNSSFYFMSVDRGYQDFFGLEMVWGNWFKANEGDSVFVVNELGNALLGEHRGNAIGVFKDFSGGFNQPEKPLKLNIAPFYNYNYLCIRILEVDVRRTISFLEKYFETAGEKPEISFLNNRFEEWLAYQDRLNMISEVLAIISAALACCAIYGLSISIVRDKLKQIAIHRLCGANNYIITRILVNEFANQLLMAILIFGPVTYIVLTEILRNFVYKTPFSWLDPFIPLIYCVMIITLLCGVQTLKLNRRDLSSSLK